MNVDYNKMTDLEILEFAETHYGLNSIEDDVESELGIWLQWNKSNQDMNPVKVYYRPNHPRVFENYLDLQSPITSIPKTEFLTSMVEEVIMFPQEEWYVRYHQYLVEIVNSKGGID